MPKQASEIREILPTDSDVSPYYKELLEKQLHYLSKNEAAINVQANSLYRMKTFMRQEQKATSFVNAMCVNYERLIKERELYRPPT